MPHNASIPNHSIEKRGHGLRNSFLAVIILALGFEVTLRLLGYGSYVIYRPDAKLLWVPVPAAHKITEINHLPITINPDGFRYREAIERKPAGTYRIFSFGDSVTMGWGVDDNSHYSAVLEKRLNERACHGSNFQVISAGVNAYPNALVVERLKEVIDGDYQPDAVILAYSFNTGFEQLADLQGADRDKFLRRVELKSIARRSAAYNFVIEGLLRPIVYYRLRELLMQGSWNTAKDRPDLPVSHFLSGLQEAQEITEAHHVQLIFLLLGSEGEETPEHPYQQAMLDFAGANRIPVVNMIDVMKGENRAAMFMDHVHPTAAGHALIARQLEPIFLNLPGYLQACKSGRAVSSLTFRSAQPAQ